jgi:Asp/Glu/hydantoin racemase
LEAEGQVVGMLQNVLAHLAAKGHKIGAVTRNEAIGAELERRVAEYGFAKNYAGREVLNLSFDAINDEELWHEALTKAVDSLASQGATVVINGCSAVNVQQDRLRLEVVDPAELALQLISSN